MSSLEGDVPQDAAGASRPDSVPALRRAVAILDLVARSDGALLAADVTRRLGLPKSTAHGLLNVMMELDLLVRNPDGSLRLGPHPLQWANSFLSEMDVVAAFRNQFSADSELARYTITLTTLDRDEVVYLGCRNSNQPLGHTFRIGMRLPAPFTATGKMLLSELPDDRLEALFGSAFPPPISPRSVANLEALRRELVETRARGYSIDDGQIREGMICIGTAIRDHTGAAVAGIAISLLKSEATPELVEQLGNRMQSAADALSEQLGYDASAPRVTLPG